MRRLDSALLAARIPAASAGVMLLVCVVACQAPQGATSGKPSSLHELMASIDAANKAARVVNRGEFYSAVSDAEMRELLESYRLALSHAENVDTDYMERKYQGLGQHYSHEFVAGLRLTIQGYEQRDRAKILAGVTLRNAWADWLHDHIAEIRKLR